METNTTANMSQAEALREYEKANKVYMSTSVFTAEGKRAKEALEQARKKYIEAVESAHPNWSVI